MQAADESATRGSSWLHRASPRAKLAAFALVLAAVVVSWNLFVLIGLGFGLAAAVESARLSRRDVYALAAYPGVFALVFAFAAAPDAFTGAMFVAKSVAAALCAVTLVFTTPYPQVFAPIQAVTPTIVGDSLLMTYRSTFILLDKFSSLLTAVKLRSGLSGRRPLRAVRSTTSALGGLLLYSFDLAQREYDVMRLRGYEGRLRASAPRSSSAVRDVALVVAAGGMLAASAGFRVWWEPLNPLSWIVALAGVATLAVVDGVAALRRASRRAAFPSSPTGRIDGRA